MTTVATRAARPKGEPRGTPRAVHRQFGLSDADALDLYYAMLISRHLSEAALKLAFQGSIDVAIPSDGREAARRGQCQRGLLWRRRLIQIRLPRGPELRGDPPVTGGAVL